MNVNQFPRVWPDQVPALEAALLKHEEAVAKMAEFKKKLTSVKNKAKRVEQYVATMDEEAAKYYELAMLGCVRLAENKFILINKKLKRLKENQEKSCKQSLRLLKKSGMEPSATRWHIHRVASYNQEADWVLREVGDMLRIAKGHLRKVDDYKKSIARYITRRSVFRPQIATKEQ